MATKTRAEMIKKVLQRLGVVSASGSVDAKDSGLVGPILDSLHSRYLKRRLVNFATTAFPEWSQEPFTMCLEEEVAPYYGLVRDGRKRIGELELAADMQGSIESTPTPHRIVTGKRRRSEVH